MQGVTTALVAFIFFCVLFPERVKNRAQFYAGLGLVCFIILLDALGLMISGPESIRAFRVFAYVACAVTQVVAILVLFMAAGGLSWQDLASEMGDAYEVIRRGEDRKEVIVPLTGRVPKRREDRYDSPAPITLDTPPQAPPKAGADSGIPLKP